MDYNKYLNKSKEKYNELEQIKKDAESMESTMMKPKMKHIDSDMQDSTQGRENINQDSNIQSSNDKENSFIYATNGEQSRIELRRHLQKILDDFIQENFTNKETGLIATLTSDDVNKISSNEAISKSNANDYTQEEHFKVAENITNLYENATLKTTHADYKKSPNISNVHRFNNNITINKKEAIVKITVLERIEGKNRIYSLELEKLDPPHNVSRVSETGVAKSLSSEAAPHNDPSIYCDFDNETIPQNSSECQEQSDSNDESNEFTHKRRKVK